MELRTLASFVAVVDAGSLSAAADVVRITQPAFSRQVRQLERGLGIALFRRGHRRLELTSAGREFLPVARDLIQRADNARRLAATLGAGRLSTVTIAAPTTTLTDVITPFLTTFEPRDPVPTIREADTASALTQLDGDVDLAVVTQPAPRRFGSRSVGVLPVWAYVPLDHPWASRSRISLIELVDEPLVLLHRSYRARQVLGEALLAAGLPEPEHVESSSPQLAQALAAAGRGIAVVSDDSRFGLHGLLIEGADGERLTLQLLAAWRRDHHAAETLARLADRLAAFIAVHYPDVSDAPG